MLFSDLAIADLLGYLAMQNGELEVYNTNVLATFTKAKSK